jgi:hypothetical protein
MTLPVAVPVRAKVTLKAGVEWRIRPAASAPLWASNEIAV